MSSMCTKTKPQREKRGEISKIEKSKDKKKRKKIIATQCCMHNSKDINRVLNIAC